MEVTIVDIEKYLEEVRMAINAGKYRVEMNDRRQENQDLFMNYIIDEAKRKKSCLVSQPWISQRYYRMNMLDMNMKCYMSLAKM